MIELLAGEVNLNKYDDPERMRSDLLTKVAMYADRLNFQPDMTAHAMDLFGSENELVYHINRYLKPDPKNNEPLRYVYKLIALQTTDYTKVHWNGTQPIIEDGTEFEDPWVYYKALYGDKLVYKRKFSQFCDMKTWQEQVTYSTKRAWRFRHYGGRNITVRDLFNTFDIAANLHDVQRLDTATEAN